MKILTLVMWCSMVVCGVQAMTEQPRNESELLTELSEQIHADLEGQFAYDSASGKKTLGLSALLALVLLRKKMNIHIVTLSKFAWLSSALYVPIHSLVNYYWPKHATPSYAFLASVWPPARETLCQQGAPEKLIYAGDQLVSASKTGTPSITQQVEFSSRLRCHLLQYGDKNGATKIHNIT